jgi:hypothetical protein
MSDEILRLNDSESLVLDDVSEGWTRVSFVQAGARGPVVGIGRTREAALESTRLTLQHALDVVDVAIIKGPA